MNISKRTIIRTIAFGIVLINLILKSMGKSGIIVSDSEIETVLEYGIEVGIVILGFWKNNSFTNNAIKADKYLKELKQLDEEWFDEDYEDYDEDEE